jgi:thymidylate synthase (FAD)
MVLEHVGFTFGVGLSRAASHHWCAIACIMLQQSQRYVRYDEIAPVIPPSIAQSPEALAAFTAALDANKSAYAKLIELGVPPEDARYVLPNATPTQIMITMNVRELRHFFKMRLCTRAQWEIRDLAHKMLELCRGVNRLFRMGPTILDEPRGRLSKSLPRTREPGLMSSSYYEVGGT